MKTIEIGVEKVAVAFNGEEFIINPDLPIDTIKKITRMQSDSGNDYEKNIEFIQNSIKEYLYVENDIEKVDKFVSSLRSVSSLKAYRAITAIITDAQKGEIEEKKSV